MHQDAERGRLNSVCTRLLFEIQPKVSDIKMIYFYLLQFIGKCLLFIWALTTNINSRVPIFKTDLEIDIVFI